MKSGVYSILNTVSRKRYIGSSSNLPARLREHKNLLRRGEHPNPKLQASWNEHGMQAFVFEVLEHCPVGECVQKEQSYIDKYNCCNRDYGFNIRPEASSNLGMEKSRSKEVVCAYCERKFYAADVKAKICPPCSKPRPCLCGCGKPTKNAKHPYRPGHADTLGVYAGHKKQAIAISGNNNPSKRKPC